ncbi:MAG: DEAD/DEAH box helicase family protein [Candidatus Nomurabacteria bacterium]|nr:DEAD/DEAH box helicase family protein [Candidatus Nomurabacteria bacterium]
MKFKFNKNLEHQTDAINAIVDIFDTGKNLMKGEESFFRNSVSKVIANELEIDSKSILENLQTIQKQNKIDNITETTESIFSMDFTVEMETGTGKSYVYLRTILDLNKKYGLKKFIILVPSVAIREGVIKTIEQTHDHFRDLYNIGFNSFAYDSSKLSQVREFTQSLDLQIMIMTIQSFNSDTTVMKQTPDRFYGERPIDIVAATKPVIIMDEPQNMESELSRSAIDELKPLCKLRYSATHKHIHNLVYRLGPVDAYRNGLVKKVEVYGTETNSVGDFIFNVQEITIKKGESPKAKVILEVKNADGTYAKKEVAIKVNDDLEHKSKKNLKYKDIFISEIDARNNTVELSNGKSYKVVLDTLENKEAIFRTQIKETIKVHIKKQEDLGDQIKVLSLFFIDEVKNYRGEDPLIKRIFNEEFEIQKSKSQLFENKNVEEVQAGYFSQDREKENFKGQEINTIGKKEKLTYDLIMKNKEQLLSFSEPVSFIFSHSALKEGWDNPNIFQICTLIETNDEFTKRQKIGRGLRLPVDINGDRIHDAKVNVLTVIANESYEDFAKGLQDEYSQAGYIGVSKPANVRDRVNVKFKKIFATDNEDFKVLWNKIKQKTIFSIAINTEQLIENAVNKINEEISFGRVAIVVNKAQITIEANGSVKTIYQSKTIGESIETNTQIGNFIERISKETGLTRSSIVKIISKVSNLDLIFKNPEEYIRSTILIIEECKNDLLINEGLQYLPIKDTWKVELFEDFEGYKNDLIDFTNSKKTVYDYVLFDSLGEKRFAENLESLDSVKLFAKLPHWFVIDTPLGGYNPDWAIVMDDGDGQKLYLVRETKFVDDLDNLRPSEEKKIICGTKHFKAIGLDNFKVAQREDLRDLI